MKNHDHQYMIYCCAGSGGIFLSTVFAQVLNLNIQANFSESGDCHDMGLGIWKDVPGAINLIGNHWELNWQGPESMLYFTHSLDIESFKKTYPFIKIVLIDYKPDDHRSITYLMVKKAWPSIWCLEEYAKWAGPEYPPYSSDNIEKSEIIVNDLVRDFERTQTQAWIEKLNRNGIDYIIDFKTVMGLNDRSLAQEVSEIVGIDASEQTQDYIKKYQELNQKLYFNRKELCLYG